jgi:hypothetical protein
VQILMKDGMDELEAHEMMEVNVTAAYVGEGTPAFATIYRRPELASRGRVDGSKGGCQAPAPLPFPRTSLRQVELTDRHYAEPSAVAPLGSESRGSEGAGVFFSGFGFSGWAFTGVAGWSGVLGCSGLGWSGVGWSGVGWSGLLRRWAECPYLKYAAQPRRKAFRSSAIVSGLRDSLRRSAISRIRSRALCMALSAGQRARNTKGRLPLTPVDLTSRWWKPRKSRPWPPTSRWTMRVLAAVGSKPRPASSSVNRASARSA